MPKPKPGPLPARTCGRCGKVCKSAGGLAAHNKLTHPGQPKLTQAQVAAALSGVPVSGLVLADHAPEDAVGALEEEEGERGTPEEGEGASGELWGEVSVTVPEDGQTITAEDPAEAEEGEKPLEEKPVLTKETLKGMLEEIMSEQKEEADRRALQNAVTAAASDSSVAKDLAGKACQGVECLQQAINGIGAKLDEFSRALEGPPEPPAPPTAPAPVPPPPLVRPVREHRHEHPAHLSSTEMAEGVLDRIMSCDQCSPAMKAALKRRLHKYLPDYEFGEETLGGEELPSGGGEEDGVGEHHQVAGGEKGPAVEPVPAEAGTSVELAPIAAAGPASVEPVPAESAPVAAEPTPGDDPRKKYRDPLNWI